MKVIISGDFTAENLQALATLLASMPTPHSLVLERGALTDDQLAALRALVDPTAMRITLNNPT